MDRRILGSYSKDIATQVMRQSDSKDLIFNPPHALHLPEAAYPATGQRAVARHFDDVLG
jgi:hypothetical protein